MHLVYPPKFCITILFPFSPGITVVPREIKDNRYIIFFLGGGGVNKMYYGLCESSELSDSLFHSV